MSKRYCLSCHDVDPLPGRQHTTDGWCTAEPYAPTPADQPPPPAPAALPGTPATPTPAKPADGRTEPQGENA